MSLAAFAARPASGAAPRAERRTIPFDHGFKFVLRDEPGRRRTFKDVTLSATVEVSVEAAFTAVAIGYGFIPEVSAVDFGPGTLGDLRQPAPPRTPPQLTVIRRRLALRVDRVLADDVKQAATQADGQRTARDALLARLAATSKDGLGTRLVDLPGDVVQALTGTPDRITLGDLLRGLSRALREEGLAARGLLGPRTSAALATGIRVNAEVLRFLLTTGGGAPLDADLLARLFQVAAPEPQEVRFLYGLHDQGTGRELQSEPLLNTAGLGAADGVRPFRRFAQPITFAPRSTIRLDVVPKFELRGELQVVLHGFKVLGGAGTPTATTRRRRRPAGR